MDYGDLSEVKDAPTTSVEALRLSMAWATGTRSHTNLLQSRETYVETGDIDRQLTNVRTIEADAAEAVKWARIAAAMSDIECRDLEVHYKLTGQIQVGA